MTSGFKSDDDDANYWIMYKQQDWAEASLKFPLGAEPGQQFLYDSAAMHLLSVILTEYTGMNALEYAQSRLFKPLGITVHGWTLDPLRNSEGAAGLVLTPRDMAKFGYLYLNGGMWNGQEIVPEWFVSESTRKHVDGGKPEPADYGYLWWVMFKTRHAGYCAAGYGGQYVFVFPDRDLVIVTTGNHTLVPAPKAPVPHFFRLIIPSVQDAQS
jgi:CubicO group peptidase (beta-lactamase class C family)